MLMRQLINAFPQQMLSKFGLEIKLLLDYLFFRFTISNDVGTPGNLLQNLTFKFRSQNQKLLLLAFTVLLPYAIDKLNEVVQRKNWTDP